MQAFYRAIDRAGSPLEPALRALVNVKVSQINRCSFCADIGQVLLQKRGVSLEKIGAISEFESSPMYTERERAALAYAEAITISGREVTDLLFERLRKEFSDDEIVELTALIGYQNLSSRFNAALDVPAQEFCLPSRGKY